MKKTLPVLKKVVFPSIGFPAEPRPDLPPAIYAGRLNRLRSVMHRESLDAVAIYGDREHFGSIHWLTNFDPRFEEALLVVLPLGTPVLFVGNEGLGYSNVAKLQVERRLFQTFSLPGQPRDKVRPLKSLLAEAGIGGQMRVGAIGWKHFTATEEEGDGALLDFPEFIASALRAAIAPAGELVNRTTLLIDPETGLRNLHEPEQLATFEWISTVNSESVLRGIRALRPAIREREIAEAIGWRGLPFSCHPVVSSGEHYRKCGMPSPGERAVRLGDPLLISCSYQGANLCRFGWLAATPEDLPSGLRDHADKVSAPFFDSLAEWYRLFRCGTTGAELDRAVRDRLAPRGFTLGLNAGHQIDMEEWTHTAANPGSPQRLVSGSYWQSDFFPAYPGGHIGAFAEDGLALADGDLRERLQADYPGMWSRIQARRAFMSETLRLEFGEELLPFANFQAAVFPFMLDHELCLVR